MSLPVKKGYLLIGLVIVGFIYYLNLESNKYPEGCYFWDKTERVWMNKMTDSCVSYPDRAPYVQ